MPYLLAGLIILWLALTSLRAFTRLSPAAAAKALRQLGRIALLGLAALFVLRGRIDFAVVAAGVGGWFLGLRPNLGWLGVGTAAPRRKGAAISRVRSAMIEMELDHESGVMRGGVLAGIFQDRALDSLSRRDCALLLAECRRDDPEGARLLEAYLDRRFPGWRATAEGDPDAGAHRGASVAPGPMTENEAYEVLGLHKGASRDEITRAHRTLMKKLHPDHGGTTHLAARANEAKDVLMRRHT